MTVQVLASLIGAFGLSLLLSLLLTRMARRLAHRFGLVDLPGGRRRHRGALARLGALPVWGAFTLMALLVQAFPIERKDPYEIIRLTGLLLGGTAIFLIGLLDDKFDLPPTVQIVAQLVAAGIAVTFQIFIERFNNPFTDQLTDPWPFWFTAAISLIWLIMMMNTVNFLDGADGLAGGVNFIAAGLLFIHTLREGQTSVSLLPLVLMGTLLGFLVYNWHPSSIILGSGAVYLGFTIGALSIIGGAKMATILLVMGLPLMDVAWQVARRIMQGKNPMIGDRGHLHFRLIDSGLSPRTLCLIYYVFCALFGALALLVTSSLFKLIALVALTLSAFTGFALVARRQPLLPATPESARDTG